MFLVLNFWPQYGSKLSLWQVLSTPAGNWKSKCIHLTVGNKYKQIMKITCGPHLWCLNFHQTCHPTLPHGTKLKMQELPVPILIQFLRKSIHYIWCQAFPTCWSEACMLVSIKWAYHDCTGGDAPARLARIAQPLFRLGIHLRDQSVARVTRGLKILG